MAIVVDTCSLVMIAKNYLPLDKDGQLYSFLEEAFSRKDLMLLDVILDESKRTSKGIAVEKMPFLKDKKLVIPTKDLFPCAPERFSNMIDNNFCVRLKKQELTEEEYIEQKEEYLKTGDAKIIIYALNVRHSDAIHLEEMQVMTEETRQEGVWRSIWADGQLVGSISVERKDEGGKTIGEIGYMILTPFWSQGIGTEAVRQICGIAFQELALERIIGQVFPENVASARVLEKNGFQLNGTIAGAVVKCGTAMDVRVYRLDF